MVPVKEIIGLKCPNHEYARDNHHFLYQPAYLGARPIVAHVVFDLCIKYKGRF